MNDPTTDRDETITVTGDDLADVLEAAIAARLGVDIDAFNALATRAPAMLDAIKEAANTIDDPDVMKSFVASRIGADPTSREFIIHLIGLLTLINEANKLDGLATTLGLTVADLVVKTDRPDAQAEAEAAHEAWANDDDPVTHSAPDDA